MAMAEIQRVPILQQQQQNLSGRNGPSIATNFTNSRSFSTSQAFFCGVTIIPRSCITSLSLRGTRSLIPGRRGSSWLAKGRRGEGGGDGTSRQEKVDNNGATSVASPAEPKLSSSSSSERGAKGFGSPPKATAPEKKKSSKSSSGSVRRTPPTKPLIEVSPADQRTRQIETAVVASLAFLFAVIFLEGLVLAGSGFLPEEWDEFAANLVYPAFTPSVGVFLAIAASYGLWKTRGGGTGQSSR
ncbi:unnamed protein product [Calypogeia fissa]